MHILGLLLGLLAPAWSFAITITTAAPLECDGALLTPAERAAEEHWVRVDGVIVTGTVEHSTDEVLRNLQISREDRWSWRGREIISLGEGMSGLVPFLHAQGLRARGIDLWYDSLDLLPNNRDGLRMRAYVEEHRALLQVGDVTQLDLPDESVDVVLSHFLLNNLEMRPFISAHEEILRVMRPGAEARLFAPNKDVKTFYEALRQDPVVSDFLIGPNLVIFRKAR